MKDKLFFLDTNILVYTIDSTDKYKYQVANDLLEKAVRLRQGVISSQVVQEFCSVVTKKFKEKPNPVDLGLFLERLLLPRMLQVPSASFYRNALLLFADNSLSFYDALIIQAALDLGCNTLYSEDLQDGHRYDSLIIKNPFALST